MFVISGAAEIKNVNLRMEAHGDDSVRAVDVKLIVADVEAKRLDSAIADIEEYWRGDRLLFQETYPVRVQHTIENVTATLTVGNKKITLTGADVRKVSITPRHSGRCQVELSIRCIEIGKEIIELHKWLKGTVELEIVERQLSLPDMEQESADG